jgi:hypothetical protein
VIFALLGAIMVISDVMMEALPNIHLLGLFVATFTLVYRFKALIPIYVYVGVYGVYGILFGGLLWWFPYLYIWTILWAAVMLIPKWLPRPLVFILAHIAVTLHGLAFGTLYAPAQAMLFHLDFRGMLAWIAVGFPFDVIHAAGNFAFGFFIAPLTKLLELLSYGKRRTTK